MGEVLRDVRFGLRMLVKAPVVTLVAAGSLALGVAACTSIFSVAYGFLYAPFPFEAPERLALIQQRHRADPDPRGVSAGNFIDVTQQLGSFQSVAAWRTGLGNLSGTEEPVQVSTAELVPGTLSTLGRPPLLGRGFVPADVVEGAAILTHDLWSERYGSDRGILGRTIELDGRARTVVGVTAPDFEFLPADVDVMTANDFETERDERERRSLLVIGRLAAGVTVERASREVGRAFEPLVEGYAEANRNYSMTADRLRSLFPGPSDTRLVHVLMAVASFVLLIAGANVANLLLARAETRQKEVSLRTALGAGRRRLMRQFLTESVLLAVLGGLAGFALSIGAVRFLATAMPPQIPPSLAPRVSGSLIMFTAAVSVLAGLLVGIAPALQSLGGSARDVLTEGSRGGTAGKARRRLRSALVVGQVAVALALLVGSGALTSLARQLIASPGGYDPDNLLTFRVSVRGEQYEEEDRVAAFHEEVVAELSAASGVSGVAVMNELPRGRNTPFVSYAVAGEELAQDAEPPAGPYAAVNPGYFEAMDIQIREGRAIDRTDRSDTRSVVVVNEEFVRRHFPDGSPIGRSVLLWNDEPWNVIGVAEDVLQTRMPDQSGGVFPMFYVPMTQRAVRDAAYALRVEGDPLALASTARASLRAADSGVPVSRLQTQHQFVRAEMAGPRAIGIVMAVFGAVALFLSAIGLYGMIAHSVEQRTREMGIRMALGAGGGSVVAMVTRQGLSLTVLGLILGAPLGFLIVRFAGGILEGTEASLGSPGMYLGILAALLGVTAFASWLPALRASRVPPMVALQRN